MSESQYYFTETQAINTAQRAAALAIAERHVSGEALRECRRWICNPRRTQAQLRQLLTRWDEPMPTLWEGE